jgi:hypothetical protein
VALNSADGMGPVMVAKSERKERHVPFLRAQDRSSLILERSNFARDLDSREAADHFPLSGQSN